MLGRMLIALCALAVAAPAHAVWRYEAKRDEFSDEIITTAWTNTPGFMGGVLFVRCDQGVLDIGYQPGEYIGNDNARVFYRFGKGDTEEEVWEIYKDGTGVYSNNAVEFARTAMTSASVVVEVEDFRGSGQRETFNLAGSSVPISKVFAQCQLMTRNPWVAEPEIWRRVAQEIDGLSVEQAQSLSDQVAADYPDAKFAARKSTVLYRKLTDFWLDYWKRCADEKLADSHCRDYLKRREADETDYPIEVVRLYELEQEKKAKTAAASAAAQKKSI